MTEPEVPISAEQGPVICDLRTLHPRERHPMVFEQLHALAIGETLRLINDHDPVPLRYQLSAEYPDQYHWVSVEAGPEAWMVDITARARVVDARPIIAAGGEPFQAIMEAATSTRDDEVLVVYAPFEPKPLESALAEQGFYHVAEQISEDTWRVRFLRR